MLEFDGQPIDPAIVSAQPMKPAQSMDLPQMVCPSGKFKKNSMLMSFANSIREKIQWELLLTKVQSNHFSSPRVPAIATQHSSCPT